MDYFARFYLFLATPFLFYANSYSIYYQFNRIQIYKKK